MSFFSPYEVSSPEVVAEDFGGEIVVLNLNNGKYFSLAGPAANLWRDLEAGHIPQNLFDHIHQGSSEQAAGMKLYVEALVREQLIRPRTTNATTLEAASATVLLALSPDAVFAPLEMYDDMAELILSDPIHDVDEEMGWPVKPRS